MELVTLLGAVGGGLMRIAPEVLNWLDRNNARSHEIKMQDKALEFEKLRGSQRMEELRYEGQQVLDSGGLDALEAAIKAQGKTTRVPWVDAINSTVRPFLTYYWCVVLVTLAMGCQLWIAMQTEDFANAFLSIWGQDEKIIIAGMMNFWFLDRVIRKNNGI